MRVIDLFSGCGGMSIGFKRQGFNIMAAVDLEVSYLSNKASTRCNDTYYRNVGVAPINEDVSKLDPKQFRVTMGLARGELDVLIACPPCTGFSQINPNNHKTDDPRNMLSESVGDLVSELRPKFVVMENVGEFIHGKNKHHFLHLKQRFERLGYNLYYDVHLLSDYGLPQRRKRALVIASRTHEVNNPLQRQTKVTVRDVIGQLPRVEPGKSNDEDPMHVCPGMGERVSERVRQIPPDGGSWAEVLKNESLPLTYRMGLFPPGMYRQKGGGFTAAYGRMKWDDVAPTIKRECDHPGKGRYLHPEQHRLLTVREMALLQGFPKEFYFVGPLWAKYAQIGNAVPPVISEQIAQYVLKCSGENSMTFSLTS